MKQPAYCQRYRPELRRALRWAQRKLNLLDWTIRLVVDQRMLQEPLLRGVRKECGGNAFYSGRMTAVIGVRCDVCQSEGVDPLKVLFHEVAHLVIWASDMLDPKGRFEDLWEQAAERIALVLYDLWRAEGKV